MNDESTRPYPPLSPPSPHRHFQNTPNARWSLDPASRPRTSSSRSPLSPSPNSPLVHPPYTSRPDTDADADADADDYIETNLGDITAHNQVAQERNWGPYTTLSEAAERHVGQLPALSQSPYLPHQYELEPYDGGYYLEAPAAYPQEQPSLGLYPHMGAPASIVSGNQTLGGASRKSAPIMRSPSLHPSVASPSSEPANMFNVYAAHHLPGGRARPQDMFAGDHAGPGSPVRTGDPLPGFPNWSRTWYDGHLSADGHAYTTVPPGSGQSGWENETLTNSRHSYQGRGPHGPYLYGRAGGMEDSIKEERKRMLEKEFGLKVSHKDKRKAAAGFVDNQDDDVESLDKDLPFGSINSKGQLVLPLSKWRTATRWLQILASLGALCSGVGGVLLIHPKEKPAVKATIPTFVLYGVSAFSTVVCFWLFVIRPCCCRSSPKPGKMSSGGFATNGGIVIPVMTTGQQGFSKKGKMKPGKGYPPTGGTTVHLIVDPTLLGGNKEPLSSSSSSEEEEEEEDNIPCRKRKHHQTRGKLGILEKIQLENQWKTCRKSIIISTVWDFILIVFWIISVCLSFGVGKKCSPGSFQGWCDFYNGAIAFSVFSVFVFVFAIFLDFRALSVSKRPPQR